MSMVTAFGLVVEAENYSGQLFPFETGESVLRDVRQKMQIFVSDELLGHSIDNGADPEPNISKVMDVITISAEEFARVMVGGYSGLDPETDEFLSETMLERINTKDAQGVFVIDLDSGLGFYDVDIIGKAEVDIYLGLAERMAATVVEEARCRKLVESLGSSTVPESVQNLLVKESIDVNSN